MNYKTPDTLRIGKAVIDLLYRGGEFLGLGSISIDGVKIRSGTMPLRPLLLSVDGVAFGNFTLDEIINRDDGKILCITAYGLPTGQSLYLDHLGIQTARFAGTESSTLTFRWLISPHEQQIDKTTYCGLFWHYEVDGGEHTFFDMSEQGSWEIGGTVEGNRLLYQGEHLGPEIDITDDTVIDTAWTAADRTIVPDAPDGPAKENRKLLHPLCAMPLRVSKNQPFDFLSHRLGTLTSFFAPDMEYVGCLMLKTRGQSICPWQERYRFKECSKFETPRRYVLFAKRDGTAPRVQVRNQWTRIYDEVGNSLRGAHNIGDFRNPATAELCTWFHWSGSTREKYLKKMRGYLNLLSETFMPLFSQMGFTASRLHPIWKSSLPIQPNCCVDRFEPAEVVGGWDALRKFNQESEKEGITVYPWVSMHLWEKSSIFQEHPDWKIKARDTWNYTPGFPSEIAQVDLAGGYADYLFEMLKRVRERTDISGLFFDTLCTHALYNISWHRQSETHVKAVGDLLGRLSGIGYDLSGETITPFVRSVRGDNAIPDELRWKVSRHKSLNASRWANYKLGCSTALGDELDTPFDWQNYYRLLANRSSFTLCFTSGDTSVMTIDEELALRIEGIWSKEATKVNLDYKEAQPFLQKRILLEDDAGVLWEDEKGVILHLFCFKPLRHPVRAASVRCLTTGKKLKPSPEISCESYNTYRIEL